MAPLGRGNSSFISSTFRFHCGNPIALKIGHGEGLACRHAARLLPGGDDTGALPQSAGPLHRIHFRLCFRTRRFRLSFWPGFRMGLPSRMATSRASRDGIQKPPPRRDNLPNPYCFAATQPGRGIRPWHGCASSSLLPELHLRRLALEFGRVRQNSSHVLRLHGIEPLGLESIP